MSERPDADKTTEKTVTIGPVKAEPPHPTTVVKGHEGEPPKKDVPNKPSTMSGGGTYPDGYKMVRTEDGRFTLTEPGPGGRWAEWDAGLGQWVDPETHEPMPSDWSKGHYPGTSGSTSPGSSQAHPLGNEPPKN